MVVRTGWSLDNFRFAYVYSNGQEAVEWSIDP